MADEWVWMRHSEHGGTARVPLSAVDGYEVLGWEPCDQPEEPNPVLAGHIDRPTAVVVDEASDDSEPEPDEPDDVPASAGPDHDTEE